VAESYYRIGFDPVKVFKVSNIYFVIDGNHRISVSRALKNETIIAQVYEFDTPIILDKKDDLINIRRKWQAARSGSMPDITTSLGPNRMANARQNSGRIALLAIIVGAILIGTVPIFVRFSDLGPSATGFWRVFLTLPVLLLWVGRRHGKTAARQINSGKKGIFWLVTAGICFAGDQAAFNMALQTTTVANATLLINMAPLVVALTVWLLFRERFTRFFVLGLAVAVVGAMIVVSGNAGITSESFQGDLFALLAAIFTAGYTISLKQIRDRLPVSTAMLLIGLVSSLALFISAELAAEDFLVSSWQGWLPLLALAFVSHVGGQGLITFSLAHLSASTAAICFLVQPVAAALLASILFQEPLGMVQVIGGAVVLAGISITQFFSGMRSIRLAVNGRGAIENDG
jgi:drug/metabolite transporter (DMT)-like permease